MHESRLVGAVSNRVSAARFGNRGYIAQDSLFGPWYLCKSYDALITVSARLKIIYDPFNLQFTLFRMPRECKCRSSGVTTAK